MTADSSQMSDTETDLTSEEQKEEIAIENKEIEQSPKTADEDEDEDDR